MSWSPRKLGHITQIFEGGRIFYSVVCTFAQKCNPFKNPLLQNYASDFPNKSAIVIASQGPYNLIGFKIKMQAIEHGTKNTT